MAIMILMAGVAVAIVIGTGRASSLWACIPGILLGLALGQTHAGIKVISMLGRLADNIVVVIGRLAS